MDKEEVLEVEDQIQKALEKESKNKKEDAEEIHETIKSTSKSTVPATPVTKETKLLKEEIEDEDSLNASKSSDVDVRQVSLTKKAKISKTSMGTSVPPSPKKAEGSKHL